MTRVFTGETVCFLLFFFFSFRSFFVFDRDTGDADLDDEDDDIDDTDDDDDEDEGERVRLDDFFFLCVDDFRRGGDSETDFRLSLDFFLDTSFDFFDNDLECVTGGETAGGAGGGGGGGGSVVWTGDGERLRDEIDGDGAFGFGFLRADSTGESCLRRLDLLIP